MPDYPTDPDCIFCKIVAGEIPCHKLYEDEHVLAFLDVQPLSAGHTLVIPKGHYQAVEQMPDEVGAAIGRCLPKLGKAILNATGSTDWNILQNNGEPAGQEVMHVHFHLIPRKAGTDLRDAIPGNGLPKRVWPATQVDHSEAAKQANLIVDVLSG
ncbi:MAG: HIT family protein [Phycisphaeraceae bacterium]